ncbi:Mur ligase family protein [Neorhodopirellula pilleata]|uniref:MurE-like ligase n=1 Tax=Neorhodopirellula pilleata TaxID=2714738 RepID=A0A5C6A176_9BACT|nr:Mur ligase family protein [Neorhodopirellula pilleata]TWT93077.1 MurE-like ligase [Neorhodopirellula pilleata]
MHHAINRHRSQNAHVFWTSPFVARSESYSRKGRLSKASLLAISNGRSDLAPSDLPSTPKADLDLSGSEPSHLLKIHEPSDSASSHNDVVNDTARSLKDLLPQVRFFSGDDIRFESIAESVQRCTPGQLVVYRIGLDCPVEFIATALARGAAGILTEQVLPVPLVQCIVGDTDRALAEIASRELIDENGTRPDQRLLTIGVVGESGKTSTALCLATVLKDSPCRVAYETDLGHSDGIGSETIDQPVPRGAELLRRIHEAADAGAAIAVLELEDNALRSGGYDQIGLDMLVITGRNRPRTDFGPSAIDCAIERVLPDGILIVNVSDATAMSAATASGLTIFSYGVDTPADVSLKTAHHQDGVLTAMIRHEMNSAMMESTIGFGCFTAPLAAAAAVGVATENPLVQIAESLSRLRSIPGRIERITCEDWQTAQTQPQVYLDACGSPARGAFVLEHLREQLRNHVEGATGVVEPMLFSMEDVVQSQRTRGGQIWCVLAPSIEDTSETLMLYGRLLETLPDHCILTCHPSEKAGFLAMSHAVLDGVEDCAAMRLVADQERAIGWAMQAARPQDTIIVLGGLDRSTPLRQRADIRRVEELIAGVRSRSSQNAPSPGEPAAPPKLKLFHPDA